MKQNKWFSLFLSLLLMFSFVPEPVKAEITEPTISADVAILMDAKTKTVLYEKNAYEKHYPASITKLMTALLAIENLSLDDTITFSRDAVYSIEPGSSHIGIQEGEQLTVNQALHGLLLMSANEVANGLAEAVSGSLEDFSELMTKRAEELGATNTHFANAHGLHNENHYTTAYDMALIGSYLSDNDVFLDIMQDTTYEIPPTNITNEIRYLFQQHYMINPSRNAKIYREDVIGGKTGYTDQARHTLVTMAKQGDTTLVAVIMQSEKSTLYTDTATLLDYGFDTYQTLNLHTTDEILKTLPGYSLKSGQAYQSANYGLGLKENVSIIVPNTVTPDQVELVFNLPEYVNSTVSLDETLGSVSFVLNQQTVAQSDLVVKQIDPLENAETAHSSQFSSTIRSFTSSVWFKVALIGILLLILIIIMLIMRHKRRKRKYIKLNKLFK